ncbi:hypothetical protein LSH36_202g06028 [Paralvinella palmiformis]|uniref:E3 ubiquitin-protein ligase n=1 Tax=Paralvinella palmiformis TaxID=53620 RepID=A0AAD9JQU1_9ANNE|nr:hypothetical protein LSH36_202g06028 [Paralvinella palmiformis]
MNAPPDKPKQLPQCKHTFCTSCIDECFKKCGPKCPSCGQLYGTLTGSQPRNGRMTVQKTRYLRLPGFKKYGTIVIDYDIPSGTQGPEHPHPGKYYTGTHRTAYLPNNDEGNKVLRLLHKAFDARLIFTVGTSSTTGIDDSVTWNDIHHKTATYGGPQR